MSDYCTNCSKEMGFKGVDIDVQKIFDQLEPGTAVLVLCEGCEMNFIGNIGGKLQVKYEGSDEWFDYEPNKLKIDG